MRLKSELKARSIQRQRCDASTSVHSMATDLECCLVTDWNRIKIDLATVPEVHVTSAHEIPRDRQWCRVTILRNVCIELYGL